MTPAVQAPATDPPALPTGDVAPGQVQTGHAGTTHLETRGHRPALALALSGALAVAVATAFADSSVVVLAIPDLLVEFRSSISSASWVITAFNVALALTGLLGLALLGVPARVRAAGGLVLFLGASVVCAVAPDLGTLVAARVAQGVGAGLLLVAALPLLAGLLGQPARAVALWSGAAALGAAAGPALGGLLTQAFSWRAVFVVQAPLALLAVPALLRRSAPPSLHAEPATTKRPVLSRPLPRVAGLVGLLGLQAAVVGALFLVVVLLVSGWSLSPVRSALVATALPVGALLAAPLSRRAGGLVAVGVGAVLLAIGLRGLADLPEPQVRRVVLWLLVCGLGVGLALPGLAESTLRPPGLGRDAALDVGLRHVGLVLGLLLVTPILATDLQPAGERAVLDGTAILLDSDLDLRTKIPLAQDVAGVIAQDGGRRLPDLTPVFSSGDRAGNPAIAGVQTRIEESTKAAVTDGFRRAFADSSWVALGTGGAVVLLGLAGAVIAPLRRRSTT